MYIHLGGNTAVKKSEIIAVCDIDNSTTSRISRDFLSGAERAGILINLAEDIPKSFVLCQMGGQTKVYLSQLAPATLLKRAEQSAVIS